MSEIKLYLDEGINPQLARDLRTRGYDAVSTGEVHRLGLSDREQFQYAQTVQRAFLTHNRDDFLGIAAEYAMSATNHCGILYIPQVPFGSLLQRVLRFLGRAHDGTVRDVFLWIP